MKIAIEKTARSEETPYIARIDTSDLTIHKPSIFKSPVHKNGNGYYANICGFRVNADKPEELQPGISALLDGLINMARLPRHVFIARRAGKVYPVYTVGNEVIVTTPGGPVFQHVELAKVREYLHDYLHEIGVLGAKGESDKLHVRDTNMHTLELRRPILYMKKRLPGQEDFWAPVFENGAKDGIYVYAANARRDVPLRTSGTEVLILTQVVAEALRTDNRLDDAYDLRADRLMPEYWERLKENSIPEGSVEIGGQTIEIYANQKTWFGVEHRKEEDRFGLFLGDTHDSVVKRITANFKRRGMI